MADLTWREREVKCLVLRGMTDKAIAEYLNISPSTASRHIESILRKRSAASRHDLQPKLPKAGDFVGYVGPNMEHRNRTWEIYDFENDADGYRAALLIDPAYDAESGDPEPLLSLRDLSEVFPLD